MTKSTEKMVFGYWDKEKEQFIPLHTTLSKEEVNRAAEEYGCTPLLLDSLRCFGEEMRKNLDELWELVKPVCPGCGMR